MAPAGAGAAGRSLARYFAGSATNLARQPAEQKWKVWPSCTAWCGVAAGSTFIPHTGSVAVLAPAGAAPWSWPQPAWWWCECSGMAISEPSSYTPDGHIAITPSGVYPADMERQRKPALLNRLNRIEGQVRGIARMVEDDRYCIDVLTQVQAVRAALAKVEIEMLRDHLGHCIEGAIVSGDQTEQRRKAAELIELLERTTR